MKKYGIIGSGKCGENIIEDGLAEVSKDALFIIYGRAGASHSEDRVYDYLLENEIPFVLVVDAGAKVPNVLSKAAQDTLTVVAGTAYREIVKWLKPESGELLVLWDDAIADMIQDTVFFAHDNGVSAKELSNGLIPISVNDSKPKEEEPTVEPFSIDELRSMSIGVLRKAAMARGIDNAGDYEKEELISLITGEPMNTVTSATPMTAKAIMETHITQSERPQMQAPEGDCMVTVVMPNGTVISTPATIEEVRVLLGLSGGS